MKKQLILNEQKLKFYSTNQLRYSDRMRSNFREEISDKDTLANYILEQLKCNKVDEVSWSCFLQELMACVEIEQVPETFEELKELCKKINSKIVNENAMYESQIIIDTDKGYFGFYYYSTGRIDIVFKSAYSTNHTVAKKRTIPQTWTFIKSIVGEE